MPARWRWETEMKPWAEWAAIWPGRKSASCRSASERSAPQSTAPRRSARLRLAPTMLQARRSLPNSMARSRMVPERSQPRMLAPLRSASARLRRGMARPVRSAMGRIIRRPPGLPARNFSWLSTWPTSSAWVKRSTAFCTKTPRAFGLRAVRDETPRCGQKMKKTEGDLVKTLGRIDAPRPSLGPQAAWPAHQPDDQAHWKLYPPSHPVTSTTSPMK